MTQQPDSAVSEMAIKFVPYCASDMARLANTSNWSSSYPLTPSYQVSWIHVVLPLVCMVGISGNLLNLVILTRKRRAGPMQTLERSANIGLTALALSDLIFNIVALPYPFTSHFPNYVSVVNAGVLYYRYYSQAGFNLCLMVSTYLVMLLAVERYMVTYCPQKAKTMMRPLATTMLVILIYVLCTVATLPYFLNMRVVSCQDPGGREFYKINRRWSASSHQVVTAYMTWVWPCVAVFGPLVVLLVCNLRLVLSMRSVLLQCRSDNPGQKVQGYRVTLILIIIVFMEIMLVTPAEVLKLINPYKTWGPTGYIVAAIANVLQATNFAFNFMLYCAVDRRFRIMAKEMFTCSSCSCVKDKTRWGQDDDLIVLPLRNGHHKRPTSTPKTYTLRICKTNSKSSLYKKRVIVCN